MFYNIVFSHSIQREKKFGLNWDFFVYPYHVKYLIAHIMMGSRRGGGVCPLEICLIDLMKQMSPSEMTLFVVISCDNQWA